ncbi:hypothetical protein CDIK_3307 [Cucumispora dikerogammari]|nr:hypothetical protein CDIK_3307 [Cucumispora dikerogammari]
MLDLLHTLLKFITVILSHAHDTTHEEKDNDIIFFKYTTDGLVKMIISEEDISFESSSEDEITESDMIGIKVLTFTENLEREENVSTNNNSTSSEQTQDVDLRLTAKEEAFETSSKVNEEDVFQKSHFVYPQPKITDLPDNTHLNDETYIPDDCQVYPKYDSTTSQHYINEEYNLQNISDTYKQNSLNALRTTSEQAYLNSRKPLTGYIKNNNRFNNQPNPDINYLQTPYITNPPIQNNMYNIKEEEKNTLSSDKEESEKIGKNPLLERDKLEDSEDENPAKEKDDRVVAILTIVVFGGLGALCCYIIYRCFK